MTRLSFMIPASPTDGFRGQIAMFRRALDALGGIYADAQVVAVFGEVDGDPVPPRWRPHFERIDIRDAGPAADGAQPYTAQTMGRWQSPPEDCDFVVMSDADTMVLRPFDDLMANLTATPAVAGCIAHYPFPQFDGELPADRWAILSQDWLGHSMSLDYAHSLVQPNAPDAQRCCPFYVNFGFVVVPRSLVEPIGDRLRWLAERVAAQLREPFFSGQVALTLALYAEAAPLREIDIRYNFPNDQVAESLYPAAADDIRTIHYLRTKSFDRQQIFGSRDAFDAFMLMPLTGSNLVFQQRVRQITDGEYPF